MNILITAGGTSEKIDSVRQISNTSTGRLGAFVAEAFAKYSPESNIVYICSESAVRPQCAEIIIASDVISVGEAIRSACSTKEFDIIIHSMAISDYRVRKVSDSALMTAGILEKLSGIDCEDQLSLEKVILGAVQSPRALNSDETSSKISSDKEDLIVVLEKSPKLIAMLRGLAPSATIVGFKLLSYVPEEELINVAMALLKKNELDFVLANDMRTVSTDSHEGLLVSPDGSYERAVSKEAIADLIAKRTLEQQKSR